jgi:hypothetical protein
MYLCIVAQILCSACNPSALSLPPGQIQEVLSKDEYFRQMAKELYQQKSLLVMGRGYNYATCLEGALVRQFFAIYCGVSNLFIAISKCRFSVLCSLI